MPIGQKIVLAVGVFLWGCYLVFNIKYRLIPLWQGKSIEEND